MSLDIKQIAPYLRSKGVPQSVIKDIRMAFINDAVMNAGGVHADRLYTAVAMMLHDAYGFGHKRIFAGLAKLDELYERIADDVKWVDVMSELREKTGIVVRSGSDDRIAFEYDPE